ncbi:MAG: hypothetical protein EBR26_04340 [Microbacteriaceae bacterium]|nr:hypothetical protein [Microbacteriaceae bacterium]
MSKEEKDELLNRLRNAEGKLDAPVLPEEILYLATKPERKFAIRKLQSPKLVLNLLGGAAILALVFIVSTSPRDTQITDLSFSKMAPLYDSTMPLEPEITFQLTEEDLITPRTVTLNEYGQKLSGGLVNSFEADIWSGQTEPFAVIVIADGLYLPREITMDNLKQLFGAEKIAQVSNDVSTDESVQAIKLLIQTDSGVIHPLVIPQSDGDGYYKDVLATLIAQSYQKIEF